MSQVQDVARQVLSDVASDAGHVLASQWVAKRYEEAMTRFRPRQLRTVGAVVQPATITGGTVTLTQGSPLVTPDAPALALWQAIPSNGIIGRFLRCQDNEWYEIVAFADGVATLSTPYVVAGGSGLGYSLAARYLKLAPDAHWLGPFTHMRLQRELETMPLDQLDLNAPGRLWAQGIPAMVAEIGTTIGTDGKPGTRLVEVYPYARVAEHLTYVYWSFPKTLGFDDEIPRVIPDYVLKEGALINAMRYKMSQALAAGQVEIAATWRNEYRAQETLWKSKLQDLARSDRGVDDITFIVKGYGSGYPNYWTVRDERYAWFIGGGGGGGGSNVTTLSFVMAGDELTYQFDGTVLAQTPLFSTTWSTEVRIISKVGTLVTVGFTNPPQAGDTLYVVLAP